MHARTIYDKENEERIGLQASSCILRRRLVSLALRIHVPQNGKATQQQWHYEDPTNPLLIEAQVAQTLQVK